MKKYTVTFQIEQEEDLTSSIQLLEFDLQDLISVAVLPTLSVSLVPLSFEVKKARK